MQMTATTVVEPQTNERRAACQTLEVWLLHALVYPRRRQAKRQGSYRCECLNVAAVIGYQRAHVLLLYSFTVASVVT